MKIADYWRGCYVLLVTSTRIFIAFIYVTHVYIYTYTYIHTHTYMYVCMYIYMYIWHDMDDKNTDVVVFFSNVVLVRLSY